MSNPTPISHLSLVLPEDNVCPSCHLHWKTMKNSEGVEPDELHRPGHAELHNDADKSLQFRLCVPPDLMQAMQLGQFIGVLMGLLHDRSAPITASTTMDEIYNILRVLILEKTAGSQSITDFV
jgi:hypothetical protein